MNWEHLRAFLWLHSRLRANRSKRSGKLSNTLHTVIYILGVVVAVLTFSAALAVGIYALRTVSPATVLFAWDGAVGGFLFGWMLGLSVELQRSELLPLEKFLQYPISVSGLFLINYVSSILSDYMAMFFFIPAMLGLSVGLVIGRGAAMLWLFPLIGAFLLMVTALTYQFRGWLAVVMLNKKHRRTVISVVTITTVPSDSAAGVVVQSVWNAAGCSFRFNLVQGVTPGRDRADSKTGQHVGSSGLAAVWCTGVCGRKISSSDAGHSRNDADWGIQPETFVSHNFASLYGEFRFRQNEAADSRCSANVCQASGTRDSGFEPARGAIDTGDENAMGIRACVGGRGGNVPVVHTGAGI